jgi:hypothetical protein
MPSFISPRRVLVPVRRRLESVANPRRIGGRDQAKSAVGSSDRFALRRQTARRDTALPRNGCQVGGSGQAAAKAVEAEAAAAAKAAAAAAAADADVDIEEEITGDDDEPKKPAKKPAKKAEEGEVVDDVDAS